MAEKRTHGQGKARPVVAASVGVLDRIDEAIESMTLAGRAPSVVVLSRDLARELRLAVRDLIDSQVEIGPTSGRPSTIRGLPLELSDDTNQLEVR